MVKLRIFNVSLFDIEIYGQILDGDRENDDNLDYIYVDNILFDFVRDDLFVVDVLIML